MINRAINCEDIVYPFVPDDVRGSQNPETASLLLGRARVDKVIGEVAVGIEYQGLYTNPIVPDGVGYLVPTSSVFTRSEVASAILGSDDEELVSKIDVDRALTKLEINRRATARLLVAQRALKSTFTDLMTETWVSPDGYIDSLIEPVSDDKIIDKNEYEKEILHLIFKGFNEINVKSGRYYPGSGIGLKPRSEKPQEYDK